MPPLPILQDGSTTFSCACLVRLTPDATASAPPCSGTSDCWMLYSTQIDIITNADFVDGIYILLHSVQQR